MFKALRKDKSDSSMEPMAYDPSKCPKTSSDLIRLAKDVDFIHLTMVDMHGIPRIKVVPSDEIENVDKEGMNIVVCALCFSVEGLVLPIEQHASMHFGNIRIRPIIDTTRKWPWWNLSSNTTALQIFTQPEWLTGDIVESDPRRIALRQLKRLHDRGLDIYWGTECEFKLFHREFAEDGSPITATDTQSMFIHPLITQYEKLYTEMNRRTRAVGFKYNTFHSEYGPGQVEFVLSPEWGIKHADDLIRFKMMARDVAKECGYRASFMSKPVPLQTGNGYHLNHSIWKKENGKTIENIMFDPNDVDKMSDFTKHWLAGLLHHSNALTALTSPTVNCYRRLHKPWAPNYADWGVEDRFASFRFKSGGSKDSTYLENRCPSAASNPYLCLAATIAAGLDGVDKKLTLVSAGSKEMGSLPQNLAEALEALKNDTVFNTALGEQFIDWFGFLKLNELTKLEQVDLTKEKPEDFALERKLYFDFI